MGRYRALLFDLDGTLAETDSLHLPTWVEALLPHGIEVDEVFYRENISGRANAEIVEDSVSGFRSAVGAGFRTVGIASTQDPEKLREAGGFVVIGDFADPRLKETVGP